MLPTARDRPPGGGAGSKDQHESMDSVKQGDRDHKDQATGTTGGGLDARASDLDSPRPSARHNSNLKTADQLKSSNSPLAPGRQAYSASAAGSPTKRCAAVSEAAETEACVGGDRPQANAEAASVQQQSGRVSVAVAVRLSSLGGALPAGGDGSNGSINLGQQQPRGWAAMLPSPKQEQECNVFAADGSSNGTIVQQQDQNLPLCLPCLSPTDGPSEAANIPDAAAADTQPSTNVGSSSSSSTAQRFSPSRIGGRHMRPAPLVVPNNNTRPSSNNIGPDAPVAGSSRLSQSQILSSPAAMQHGAAARNRPALVIPPSPLGAPGCHTPTGLLSPNAMARPYHGPTLCLEDLDLDAIDDVPPANDGMSISNSSSPVISAPGSMMRSGGLRASRDQDLRRCALMNMLSPRPASMPPASPSLFTGETRARALGTASSNSSCSSTPAGPAAAGAVSSPSTATDGEAPGPAYTTADRMQQLLSSSSSRSRGGSPALTASPVGGSILDQTRPGSRSVPVTPASRYNVAAQLLHAGGSSGTPSVSSSMTASPVVPPPAHGPAAALLAGSVVPSPRTPRSPLSAMFSPARSAALGLHSGGQPQLSGTSTPLPPPLFSAGCGFSHPGSAAAAAGSARVVPMSPGSRLSAASPVVAGLAAEPAGPQQRQLQQADEDALQPYQPVIRANVDEVRSSVPIALEITSEVSLPHGPHGPESAAQAHAQQPEHLAHMLRHNLQLHDTRFGPHGESPLSPSHHSALHQQHRSEGGLRLSPTRPTPLVPPALATAAAVPGQLDASTSPAAYAGLIGVFSRSASGTAAEAAAAYDAAAAADASEVMDVGRMDVHEWLDQHSWPFRYELPPRLRDAADLVHGQGGMRPPGQVSVTAAGPSGRYNADSGQFWLQEQELLRTSTDDLRRQQRTAAADLLRTAADVQHIAAAAAAGNSPATATSNASGRQRNSFMHTHDLGGASSRPHSRLSDVPDVQGRDTGHPGTGGVHDCSAAAAGLNAAAGGVLVTASSRASESLLPLAAAAGTAARRDVAADSQHMPGHGTEAGSQLLGASSAADMPSTPLQCRQQQHPPGVARSLRHGSSNHVRLLSPGRHRYTAGSPIAEDNCRWPCSPVASPGPVATPAAAAAAGTISGNLGTADSSSSSSWHGRSAALNGAQVDSSPVGPMQQHLQLLRGRVPSVEEQLQQTQQLQAQRQRQLQLIQQQRQHQSRASGAAAAAAPAQRDHSASHSVAASSRPSAVTVVAGDAAAVLQQDSDAADAQQPEQQLAAPSNKGTVQPPGTFLGSCRLTAGQATSAGSSDTAFVSAKDQAPCSNTIISTTAATSAEGAGAAAAAAHKQAISELFCNEQYCSRLLGKLPGVDLASTVVQQALKDLQLWAAADLQHHVQGMSSVGVDGAVAAGITAPADAQSHL